MTLKCSFEVECLIAAIYHFFGLLFKHVVLAISTRLALWLSHGVAALLFGSLLIILGLFNSAEQSSYMILFIPIVHEWHFWFVGCPCHYRLLLHGFRWLCPCHLRLASLHVTQLLRLLCLAGVHGLIPGLPVHIVNLFSVGSYSFASLILLTLSWNHNC